MKDLKNIREEINKIDASMADLFTKRMDLVSEVAEYKKEHGLQIYDKERETLIVKNNLRFINNENYKDSYIDFLNSTMSISRKYQSKLIEGMKVSYSGVPGAYAYIAGKKLFPEAILVSYPSFADAYQAVSKGEVDVAILPIENSYAGDVGLVNDLMFQGNLYISDVFELEVVHNLLVKKGTKLEDIKKVISHPQALSQCHEFIEKHHLQAEECANTALAARMVSEGDDTSVAVIASKEATELYDLELLESGINDSRLNTTRFGVFSKTLPESHKSKMGDHFIIMFTVANEAGSLATTLNIIGSHGFNMRTLRSRPLKELLWSYYFFVELDGDVDSDEAKDMMRELSTICDCLKIAGTYYTPSRK